MKLEAAIKEYLIEIEIRKYTPKTIRGYKSNLYLFLHFIQKDTPEIDDLTLADVRRFTKYMVDRGNKGTYINGILKTLKSFIQYRDPITNELATGVQCLLKDIPIDYYRINSKVLYNETGLKFSEL